MNRFLLIIVSISFSCCAHEEQNTTSTGKEPLIQVIRDTVFIQDSVATASSYYYDLSTVFNFKLTFHETYKMSKYEDHYWTLVVYDKEMKRLDSIHQPIGVFYSRLLDFRDVRSWPTGRNKNKEITDNDYGLFIVRDFNFDSKEDFALINDFGFYNGPEYKYYIQQEGNKFVEDHYLSDSIIYFPHNFNSQKKTLEKYVHGSVCLAGHYVYKFNTADKKWTMILYEEIDVCKK